MRIQIEFVREPITERAVEKEIRYHLSRLEWPIDTVSTQLLDCPSVDIEFEFPDDSAIRFSYSVADAKFGEVVNLIGILLFACAFVSFRSTLTISFKSVHRGDRPQIRFFCRLMGRFRRLPLPSLRLGSGFCFRLFV
jgi:hypothetical protein